MTSLEAMSTESLVSPAAETQNPAADTQNQPEVVTQEAATDAQEGDVSTSVDEGKDDNAKALERMERRINKRTADVYRERAEKEQLRARLAELEAKTGQQQTPQDKGADPVAIAKEIAKAERFAERANDLVDEGKGRHKDFAEALKSLAAEVGPFVDQRGLPSPFTEAVLDVADTKREQAALLYHLGKNPEIAEELAGLSPAKLGARLERIQRDLSEAGKPKTSSAPKPLAPVKAAASDSELGPGLSDAEWMRRREAQIREQRGR